MEKTGGVFNTCGKTLWKSREIGGLTGFWGVEKWKSLWKTSGESGTTIFGKSLKREKRENTENVLTAENEPDLVGLTDKKRGTGEEHDPGVVNHASIRLVPAVSVYAAEGNLYREIPKENQ